MRPRLGNLLASAFAAAPDDDHHHHQAASSSGFAAAQDHHQEKVQAATGGSNHAETGEELSSSLKPEKLFKRLHPLMQEFLNKMPEVKEDWLKDMREQLKEGVAKGPEELNAMHKRVSEEITEANRQAEAYGPEYMRSLHRMIKGELGQQACAPALLAAMPPVPERRCSLRARPRRRTISWDGLHSFL
eukprot:TRINITY_DN17619_c0_g1_i1.p1 TRINITY_DN17619_c0_g1~~TRINITY_DN17619_c0_g1_i1.p1  ORF type:complete len:188 (-),score=32.01 TRINITY_DN17619_c0_g1_i1:35-598(-)